MNEINFSDLEKCMSAKTFDDIQWGNPLTVELTDVEKNEEPKTLLILSSDSLFEHNQSFNDLNLNNELSHLSLIERPDIDYNNAALKIKLQATEKVADNVKTIVGKWLTFEPNPNSNDEIERE